MALQLFTLAYNPETQTSSYVTQMPLLAAQSLLNQIVIQEAVNSATQQIQAEKEGSGDKGKALAKKGKKHANKKGKGRVEVGREGEGVPDQEASGQAG